MHVAGIIPCVDYDDLLDITIPYSKPHFDRLIVVTCDRDYKTRLCCKKHGILCLTTESWFRNSRLSKANALNDALDLLASPDWICSIDADILLPDTFRASISSLDEMCLYSSRRRMCGTKEELDRYLTDRDMGKFALGDERQMSKGSKFITLGSPSPPPGMFGYLQLWCQRVYNVRFPANCPDASNYDLLFCAKWIGSRKKWIPNCEVLHLGVNGVNWSGRVTNRWTQVG